MKKVKVQSEIASPHWIRPSVGWPSNWSLLIAIDWVTSRSPNGPCNTPHTLQGLECQASAITVGWLNVQSGCGKGVFHHTSEPCIWGSNELKRGFWEAKWGSVIVKGGSSWIWRSRIPGQSRPRKGVHPGVRHSDASRMEPKEHKQDPKLGEMCYLQDPALLDFDEDHVLASILPESVYHRSMAQANIQNAAQVYK